MGKIDAQKTSVNNNNNNKKKKNRPALETITALSRGQQLSVGLTCLMLS